MKFMSKKKLILVSFLNISEITVTLLYFKNKGLSRVPEQQFGCSFSNEFFLQILFTFLPINNGNPKLGSGFTRSLDPDSISREALIRIQPKNLLEAFPYLNIIIAGSFSTISTCGSAMKSSGRQEETFRWLSDMVQYNCAFNSVADPGCLSRTRIFPSRIPYPSLHQRI
jgi:hypothetical protein